MYPQMFEPVPCSVCNFNLFIPIAKLSISSLGLYSDNRFEGRSILSMTKHYDSLEEVPVEELALFMKDIQESMQAIRSATGSPRVNVAILGNRESHVHAHLIPRYPDAEEFPDCSPWNDERAKQPLSEEDESLMVLRIKASLLDP